MRNGMILLGCCCALACAAHEWHRESGSPDLALVRVPLEGADQVDVRLAERVEPRVEARLERSLLLADASLSQQPSRPRVSKSAPAAAAAFEKFSSLVTTRWDESYLYVESEGWPNHNMMIGITAWQQQVPIPQRYRGANAWRIPLEPKPSATPVSIKGRFLRGAIALAVNGIPIFNPQNNRGELSKEIGELDQWGGHCGRADDYHYHAAPLHLQDTVGTASPIAYALDGYPLYGLMEPDGAVPGDLDPFNGHHTASLGYHYHSSLKYPYVNGGFHGSVVEAGGQVDPQPSAQPIRPDLTPLRGARITGFKASDDKRSASLSYEISGKPGSVQYGLTDAGSWRFQFVSADGTTREESYEPGSARGGGGRDGRRPERERNQRPRTGAESDRPPRERADDRGAQESTPLPFEALTRKVAGFELRSAAVAEGAALPLEHTGDGAGISPPLEWSAPPEGTRSLALVMHHRDPEGRDKVYWTLYNLTPETRALPVGASGVGVPGVNTINGRSRYAPPQSKGPGLKRYIISLYALSKALDVSSADTALAPSVLLEQMRASVLGSADLNVTHTRTTAGTEQEGPQRGGPSAREPRGAPSAQSSGTVSSASSRASALIKPALSDLMRVNVYADNWFALYINGKLRAVDPIEFTPHNVVSFDLLPEYPMTIAVLVKDNADPATGLEYGDHIGDGGFIIRFSDGTVSNARWKARAFSSGPLNRDIKHPQVRTTPLPKNWFASDFDDSEWASAVEFSQERVNPKEAFFKADFTDARFIWTEDLDLDNTVVFRTRVEKPGWKPRWNTKPDLRMEGELPW